MKIVYKDPGTAEEQFRAWAPPAVYKYRNWQTDTQKDMLRKQQIWFAHPVTLNDPKDLRPEYAYDQAEVESHAYFHKLLATVQSQFPHIADPAVLYQKAYDQWQFTIADPRNVFDSARQEFETDESFNPYGVFSTSTDSLSKQTWELYSDDFKGYCMGFDTTALWRQVNCTTGYLTYCDDPFPYSFLRDPLDNGTDLLFYKETKWSYEKEYRFTTVHKPEPQRLKIFTPDTVTEVIIGHNMPQEHQDELILALKVKAQYRADLPVYVTALDKAGNVIKVHYKI